MAIDIEKLEDSPHLLDLLIQMEDVLDSLDVYVFKHWIDGELVEGPKVRRYWLDMALKYPFKKMPDPRAGLRLLKHGIRVDFEQSHEENSAKPNNDAQDEDGTKIWLIRISIPRRLISELSAGQLDFYDDEVDVDDVQDAQDTGMNDESGYDGENGDAAAPQADDPTLTPDDAQAIQPAGGTPPKGAPNA